MGNLLPNANASIELDSGEGTDVDQICQQLGVKKVTDATDEEKIYQCLYVKESDSSPELNHDGGPHTIVKSSSTKSAEDSNLINQHNNKPLVKKLLGQNDCTVFVGNISYRITKRELWDFFSTFGTVTKTYIVMDHLKYHRRSRGIGFVTFSSEAERRNALTATENELILDNRLMRVSPADRKRRQLEHIGADQYQVDLQVEESVLEGIHLLPNDVLLYIFSFLCLKDKVQVERVCKRWQRVVLQSWQAVEKLDINGVFGGFMNNMLTDNIFRLLLKKGCWNLKELDLSPSPYLLTDWAVELIGQRCKKLVKLDLTSVKVTKLSLKFLSSSCKQLKWIRLKNCNGFGEKGLWWLFHHCKLLEFVDVTANHRISGQCFYMLSETLGVLILEECASVTDEGVKHLVNRCPRLEHLDLRGCVCITTTAVESLSKGLRHLKHLDLKGVYPKISQGNLSFSGLNSLEVLAIVNNSSVTDATILTVCRSNPRLRCLNIEGSVEAVSDTGISAISTYCRNIEELNISYISQISVVGFTSLTALTNLKKFSIKGCHQLSDEDLIAIGSACFDLEFIDVSGCLSITEASIKVLVDIHSEELTTNNPLRLNIGGTGVDVDFLKTLPSTHDGIQISTCSTVVERFIWQSDDSIVLGGMYTDDEGGDSADDNEDLAASNYSGFMTDWHNDYNNDYHDDYHDYYDGSHGYHEDFLEADDPFLESEQWDLS
ncbi:uncharacterized protein LOC117121988 isoform X2 [Anneissia japonica]|uniref:uncharacterized protein LOC117121988 isoform X2 n=1 Tax=Anneissia japonica TaxID=1529436 RepID=UPI001425B64C|nr:uncharacterized protein LOC117121988 isoform X2 [Anneissia japonica]